MLDNCTQSSIEQIKWRTSELGVCFMSVFTTFETVSSLKPSAKVVRPRQEYNNGYIIKEMYNE